MTDPVPSKVCPVCECPDADHYDWCTPQAREEQRPSKDLCSQLRALPAGYRLLGYTAAEEIERLRRPAHEREPPHCPTCECWKADAQSAPEPEPALRPDGMPEPSLDVLKRVAARMGETAPDTAYLAQWAVEQIEEHDQSFDLRWKADMRAIKRWQEAHPGNDLTWPDHADLCVWLLEQFDARAAQPPRDGQ
jgi:hypothetical protein